MGQQVINQVAAGDGLGDTLYVAFQKTNANFTALFGTGLYASSVLASGNNNNLALPGPGNYILDLDATAGNATVTGLIAQGDGQRVTLRRKDATGNTLTLASLSGSSASANQLQIVAGGLGLPLQYSSITLQYSSTLGYWVQI